MNGVLRAEVERWLRYAEEDLAEAVRLVNNEQSIPRHAAWLARQAAEKALKAILIYLQIEFPRTHDLEALRRLIPPEWSMHQVRANLDELSSYAVEARYPGEASEITASEARGAVESASDIVRGVLADIEGLL